MPVYSALRMGSSTGINPPVLLGEDDLAQKNEVWQKGQPLRPLYYAIELEVSYMTLNQIQDMDVI